MKLVIGNKNYSSWSMRPWLLLRHHGIDFEEIRVPLFSEGYQQILARYSPSMRVPVLLDADLAIWDSLAICEYVSERYLQGKGYPAEMLERARCRSYCNEMHSGFTSIRSQLPMNCRARRCLQLSAEVQTEVKRVDQIWSELRETHAQNGSYLFGQFGIADCMFAPMVMRFHTYQITPSAPARAYMDSLLAHPAVGHWLATARIETDVLPQYEVGEQIDA